MTKELAYERLKDAARALSSAADDMHKVAPGTEAAGLSSICHAVCGIVLVPQSWSIALPIMVPAGKSASQAYLDEFDQDVN